MAGFLLGAAFSFFVGAQPLCEPNAKNDIDLQTIMKFSSDTFRSTAELYNQSQKLFAQKKWEQGLSVISDPSALVAKLTPTTIAEKDLARNIFYNRGVAFFRLGRIPEAYESFRSASYFGTTPDLIFNLDFVKAKLEEQFRLKLNELSKIPLLIGDSKAENNSSSPIARERNQSGFQENAKTSSDSKEGIDWKALLDSLDSTKNPKLQKEMEDLTIQIAQLEEQIKAAKENPSSEEKFLSPHNMTFKKAATWTAVSMEPSPTSGRKFGFNIFGDSASEEDEDQAGTEVRGHSDSGVFSNIWVSSDAPTHLFTEAFGAYNFQAGKSQRNAKTINQMPEFDPKANRHSIILELKYSKASFRLPQSPIDYAIDPRSIKVSGKTDTKVFLKRESDGTVRLDSSEVLSAGTQIAYDLVAATKTNLEAPLASESKAIPLLEVYRKRIDSVVDTETSNVAIAERLLDFFEKTGRYTTDDGELDKFLKRGPGTVAERLAKIHLQVDLPKEIQGKGMDCNCWAEHFVHTLRDRGVPTRMVSGYSRDPGQQVLDPASSRHAWVQVWDNKENRWIELDPTPSTRADVKLERLRARVKDLERKRQEILKALSELDLVSDPIAVSMKFRDVLWKRELGWQNLVSGLRMDEKHFDPVIFLQLQTAKKTLIKNLKSEILEVPIAIQESPKEIQREFLMHQLALIEWVAPFLSAEISESVEVVPLIQAASEKLNALQDQFPVERLLKVSRANGPHRLLLSDGSLYKQRGDEFSWRKVASRPLVPRLTTHASRFDMALSDDGKHWSWLVGDVIRPSVYKKILFRSSGPELPLLNSQEMFGKGKVQRGSALEPISFEGNFQGYLLAEPLPYDASVEKFKVYKWNGDLVGTESSLLSHIDPFVGGGSVSRSHNFSIFQDKYGNIVSSSSGGEKISVNSRESQFAMPTQYGPILHIGSGLIRMVDGRAILYRILKIDSNDLPPRMWRYGNAGTGGIGGWFSWVLQSDGTWQLNDQSIGESLPDEGALTAVQTFDTIKELPVANSDKRVTLVSTNASACYSEVPGANDYRQSRGVEVIWDLEGIFYLKNGAVILKPSVTGIQESSRYFIPSTHFDTSHLLVRRGPYDSDAQQFVRWNGSTIAKIRARDILRTHFDGNKFSFDLGNDQYSFVTEENLTQRAVDLVFKLILPTPEFLMKAQSLMAAKDIRQKELKFLWRNFLYYDDRDGPKDLALESIRNFLYQSTHLIQAEDFEAEELLHILKHLSRDEKVPVGQIVDSATKWKQTPSLIAALSEPMKNGWIAADNQRVNRILEQLRASISNKDF